MTQRNKYITYNSSSYSLNFINSEQMKETQLGRKNFPAFKNEKTLLLGICI